MGNQTLLLLAIMAIVVIVGTAMDMTPTILILTPILMPIIKAAGIDPVYFGVLFIVNNSIGLITPPVGTVLNVVAGVSRISMEDLIKGVWPFLLAELVVLLLMVLFPAIVIWPARLARRLSRPHHTHHAERCAGEKHQPRRPSMISVTTTLVSSRSERPSCFRARAGRDQGPHVALRLPERAGAPARAGGEEVRRSRRAEERRQDQGAAVSRPASSAATCQTVSALQGGTIDLTVLNAGLLVGQVKEFGLFDLPFLFESGKEADAVVDGPFGREAGRDARRPRTSFRSATGSSASAT